MSSVNLHSGTAEQHSSPSMVHGQSQYTAADKMSALSMAHCRSDYSAAADMSTHFDEFAFHHLPADDTPSAKRFKSVTATGR
jgi:hypothetical protein